MCVCVCVDWPSFTFLDPFGFNVQWGFSAMNQTPLAKRTPTGARSSKCKIPALFENSSAQKFHSVAMVSPWQAVVFSNDPIHGERTDRFWKQRLHLVSRGGKTSRSRWSFASIYWPTAGRSRNHHPLRTRSVPARLPKKQTEFKFGNPIKASPRPSLG